MSIDNQDNDGSDIFWPGYVDAVTNLVLNLLFLLTIMTVAVFMFALELGRASLGGSGNTPVAATKPDAADPKMAADPIRERAAAVKALQNQIDALSRETPADAKALRKRVDAINAALNGEIKLLNKLQAQPAPQKVHPGEPEKVVPATVAFPQPKKGLDITVATDNEVLVRFIDDAITLNPAERAELRDAVKAIVATGKSSIYVEVPAGFSEAKRMGFYRAMAVRNLLLEMKVSQDRITVSVHEGKVSANASLVRVTSP